MLTEALNQFRSCTAGFNPTSFILDWVGETFFTGKKYLRVGIRSQIHRIALKRDKKFTDALDHAVTLKYFKDTAQRHRKEV